MSKNKWEVAIHIIGVEMTFLYDFTRVPISGEYVWINHEDDSGLYKIRKVVHTDIVEYDQDAWVQAEPVECGLQYVDSNSHSINDTLDKIFETKPKK